jgi:predicted nucleotidyltransferase
MSDPDADQPDRQLAAYAHQRDDLLARIIGVLHADPRVRSAWLSGAFGRGEADAWSDLDLHIAVVNDELVGFWAARHDLYAQVGRPVLVQPEMKSNAQPGAHFSWLCLTDHWKLTGTSARSARPLLANTNEPDPGLMATNRALEPELARRLPTLGERIGPLECLAVLRAQCAEVEQLHAALQALNVAIPSEMPMQVSRLALLAEAVLRSRRPTSAADLQ